MESHGDGIRAGRDFRMTSPGNRLSCFIIRARAEPSKGDGSNRNPSRGAILPVLSKDGALTTQMNLDRLLGLIGPYGLDPLKQIGRFEPAEVADTDTTAWFRLVPDPDRHHPVIAAYAKGAFVLHIGLSKENGRVIAFHARSAKECSETRYEYLEVPKDMKEWLKKETDREIPVQDPPKKPDEKPEPETKPE